MDLDGQLLDRYRRLRCWDELLLRGIGYKDLSLLEDIHTTDTPGADQAIYQAYVAYRLQQADQCVLGG